MKIFFALFFYVSVVSFLIVNDEASAKTAIVAKGKIQPAENISTAQKTVDFSSIKKDHVYVTVPGEWASLNKQNMKDFLKKKNDPAAVQQDFMAGRAVKFKQKIEVKVETIDEPLIAVRPVGKNLTFWTTPSAITKK